MRLELLLDDLVDAFTNRAEAMSAGVVVTSFDLDLPVEAKFARDGTLLMTLPRGQLATGFENPLGRLRVHCEEPVS